MDNGGIAARRPRICLRSPCHHGSVGARHLASPLVKGHLRLHKPPATQVREAAVNRLYVSVKPVGKLALRAAHATAHGGLARNEPQQVALRLRKAPAVGEE